jgi:hypothetical protein
MWVVLLLAMVGGQMVYADEGMWLLKELNRQNLERMRELGFLSTYDKLYSETHPSMSQAVVIFGGGCSGITVSDQGLIFTNHHCGYASIQQLSSVQHDYLKDGFVSHSEAEELPVPGLTVRYLRQTIDVSSRIVPQLTSCTDERDRLMRADSIGDAICDSIAKNNPFRSAQVLPFYNDNKYYLVVYDVFRDVRMVFAPPSSIGKFGGDTDNWMWPRQTIDFSVFRVYASADNQPAEYSKQNRPYHPKYVAEISLQGYRPGDFAMTIGYPGSTSRYISSWGVRQRINDINAPRIEVRGLKQDIWKKAMVASEAVRIKYASKYAGSSNYWKNSIGMNKGLARLDVIARKQAQEAAFTDWVNQDAARRAKYGDVLRLLKEGYTRSDSLRRANTYIMEALVSGSELVQLARRIDAFDAKGSTASERNIYLQDNIRSFFKNYDPALDQELLPVMLKLVKERVPAEYLPDIYKQIDKKYKGDYKKYAADLFKKTNFLSYDKVQAYLTDPKLNARVAKDPADQLSVSVLSAYYVLQEEMAKYRYEIAKGERLYMEGLEEMHPQRTFYSDANFTQRMSYGTIGGYRPFDAAWYEYRSTDKGILEKEDSTNGDFYVQPKILSMFRAKDFGPYGNGDGTMNVCFLTNNDITGGNSGSPIFDKNARVIGLAFDGNWEAMSGDIAFEPKLQRCIGVDVRAILYMIDRWGHCHRLIDELKLVK